MGQDLMVDTEKRRQGTVARKTSRETEEFLSKMRAEYASLDREFKESLKRAIRAQEQISGTQPPR